MTDGMEEFDPCDVDESERVEVAASRATATPTGLGWGGPGTGSGLVRVKCAGLPLWVRREVGPVFQSLADWLDQARRSAGRTALSSSGGYNFRPIRGYEEAYRKTRDPRYLSVHSWGLSVDFNAALNPMGGPLRTDMPAGTGDRAKALGLEWGAVWGRPDPMHFQVARSPAAMARIAAGVSAGPLPPTVTPPPAAPVPDFDVEDLLAKLPVLSQPSKHPNVRTAQGLLVSAASVGIVQFTSRDVDGDFGPRTKTAVVAYQQRMGLAADGIVGPRTWRALLAVG